MSDSNPATITNGHSVDILSPGMRRNLEAKALAMEAAKRGRPSGQHSKAPVDEVPRQRLTIPIAADEHPVADERGSIEQRLPDAVTIESDKKSSHGRFNVRITQGDKVLLAGRVNPYKSDEIENLVTRAQERLPGLNGQAEQIREQLLNLAGLSRRKPSTIAPDGKPVIKIREDEHRVIAETIEAMKADANVFYRAGKLVQVLTDDDVTDGIERSRGSKTIRIIPAAHLRERITTVASFTRLTSVDGEPAESPSHPTPWLVNGVCERGYWPGLRKLNAISDVPVLRADGTICQTPGYDAATGALYAPNQEFPLIPGGVTLDDADVAKDRLLDVVCDVPFESPEHRAAWLAALLTPFARLAFAGPSPLFLVDANVPGAGKGLTLQTIGQIYLGREMPVTPYTHDPEEMRKKITSLAIAGDRMVNFDNIATAFGNAALDAAITTTLWQDRRIGFSEQITLPLIPAWYGSGNNVDIAADTCRRVIHIRLDVLAEKPEQRTGFKHPDLIQWIQQNRSSLLVDALTILSAYCLNGKPKHGLSSFGSFEGWSSLVREAVVWVGLPDPCKTRIRLSESADTVADALGQLLDAWQDYMPSGDGLVVADTLAYLFPKMLPPIDAAAVAMRAAIESFVASKPGQPPTARQVGNRLRHVRRRVVGGRYLDVDTSQHLNTGKVWRIYQTK